MNPFHQLYCRIFQSVLRLAIPFLPYRDPKILRTVAEVPAELRQNGVDHVLLITDGPLYALGMTEPLERHLAEQNIRCTVYSRTVSNPTIQNVEEARALYLKESCGALIGFGGGSAIDCAKAVGARIARPKTPIRSMKGILRVLRRIPLLIAVPTTAGTGSEVTLASVITDSESGHKFPINDFPLIPRVAVLDVENTRSLPPAMTATTGMDALTHAVEAYIGRSTTKLTRAMAEEAVTLIAKYLLRAYRDGQDAEARTQMLQAAYDAGIAFTRSYVGYVHGVAHSLGGQYGVPHGLANAVILPYFLEEYGPSCHKALARLARKAGIAEETSADEPAARAFIAWVWEMNRAMEIPSCIPEIRAADIPALAAHAAKESNPLYPVPKLMDARELETMYYKLMPKEDTP